MTVCNLPTTSCLSFTIELVILRERGAQQRGAFLFIKNALVTLEPVKTIQAFEQSDQSTPNPKNHSQPRSNHKNPTPAIFINIFDNFKAGSV